MIDLKNDKKDTPIEGSYSAVLKYALLFVLLAILVGVVVHAFTGSIEVAISIEIIILACIVAGTIRSLVTEYHIKKKNDQNNSGPA